jgi:hypothetical protein
MAKRIVKPRAAHAPAMPSAGLADCVGIIEAIADDLERRAYAFERARDPRCVFARAYSRLSRILARSFEGAGFVDPVWVTRLAEVFADYYVRALDARDGGTLPPGAWTTVFEAGARGETSVLEDLVLGMTAHIVNDLPLALCDVGVSAPDGSSRIADYHRLNDVLGEAIEAIQKDIAERYDPWLGVLDHVFESYDEILTRYGLRISRATAWYNAGRLLDPASRADALVAIARSPEITQREILEPPHASLRFALRVARIVARSLRRYPTVHDAPARKKRGPSAHAAVASTTA